MVNKILGALLSLGVSISGAFGIHNTQPATVPYKATQTTTSVEHVAAPGGSAAMQYKVGNDTFNIKVLELYYADSFYNTKPMMPRLCVFHYAVFCFMPMWTS